VKLCDSERECVFMFHTVRNDSGELSDEEGANQGQLRFVLGVAKKGPA